MKLNSLQYAIYTLVQKFVERQTVVEKIMYAVFPQKLAMMKGEMPFNEYLQIVREKHISQTGKWGKEDEWDYFFHGGGCRLIHTITQERIQWDAPDLRAFDRYWLVDWIDWYAHQDVEDQAVSELKEWLARRKVTSQQLVFPVLDQLQSIGVLQPEGYTWHRYILVDMEQPPELDAALEVSIMHRLFVAIDLPDAIKNQLETLLTGVQGAKWVKRNQLHLTLRFIGEVETSRFQEIKQALKVVRAEPFTLTLQGVGRFPPKGAPRVLWVGAVAPSGLVQLQHSVEEAIVGLGIPAEDRPFSAHITLARLKSPPPRERIEQYLAQHAAFQTDAIPISEFILYSSVLSPQGPTYRPEARFALSDYNK